jgi:hypothetical protein
MAALFGEKQDLLLVRSVQLASDLRQLLCLLKATLCGPVTLSVGSDTSTPSSIDAIATAEKPKRSKKPIVRK